MAWVLRQGAQGNLVNFYKVSRGHYVKNFDTLPAAMTRRLAESTTVLLALVGCACMVSYSYAGFASSEGNRVFHLPGLAGDIVGHHEAGYLSMPSFPGAFTYFYFVKSLAGDGAPTIVWLEGGPGVPGTWALVSMNGPFILQSDNSTLVDNPDGWHRVANMLFLDNPVGVGYSYTETGDYPATDEDISSMLVEALSMFFEDDSHAGLRGNPLYLFGQSYGGKFVPNLAARLLKRGPAVSSEVPRLEGIGIGNGWTDPPSLVSSWADRAHAIGVLGRAEKQRLNDRAATLSKTLNRGNYKLALSLGSVVEDMFAEAVGVNAYNYLRPKAYDFSGPDRYFSREDVTKAMFSRHKYQSTSSQLVSAIEGTIYVSAAPALQEVLDNSVRVLSYTGLLDLKCNTLATERLYADVMHWARQLEFVSAQKRVFVPDGQTEAAGWIQEGGGVTMLTLMNGGHVFPMEDPAVSLAVVKAFVQGRL